MRDDISVAAKCLSKCCLSLQERPSIIGASLGVFAGFVMYAGLVLILSMSFNSVLEARCGPLGAEIGVKNNDLWKIIEGILFPLTCTYFEVLIVVVTAAGVGGWYFQDDAPKTPALVGLKWAYTSSSGPAYLAIIICAPLMKLRDQLYG